MSKTSPTAILNAFWIYPMASAQSLLETENSQKRHARALLPFPITFLAPPLSLTKCEIGLARVRIDGKSAGRLPDTQMELITVVWISSSASSY